MKIAFNARLLNSPTLRGWNRYTINLLVELSSLGIELFLYSDRPLHESHLAKLPKDSYQVRISPPMRYILWEQYWLPKQCEQDQVDILHCPLNFGLPWFSPCPCVLTLHDAIDQVYYSQNIPWYQQLNLANLQTRFYNWVARHRADHIITVSEYSKQDIVKYLQVPENKITVIYEAADANFHQEVTPSQRLQIRSKYQLKLPYIFYIGGWEKRKNIPFLLKAFAEANLDGVELVLAGGKNEQRDILLELGESLGIANRLRLLGWVDDADLPGLYAEAVCFVYPSEYEGFGLQLCEAMAVGCPVLAARSTCLPEILGDGGETFSISETTELANLFQLLKTDKSNHHDLVNKAKKRSLEFNWQITAQQTEEIYKEIAKNI
ncbi:glycosyltransferase family 1 protein [Aphanizomenon sp. CS-733/32]|uniref:glycosyltransferase family 4 protein n=1 Tax=Aphanizomenon sp. CS-733/32 TaxID=3021715 RepID=UPI00232C53D9|nr:glycosyltransferase family 1 protein [Aphanizomenon sp. CS-733/32]MDB9308645.1 glycosyltransferase family 1 protein [Aphanizomenon sp. CS-733/32]